MSHALPFNGETMTCVMCGARQQSDPKIESQWRLLVVDGGQYYACPKEFPKDGSSVKAFRKAYMAVMVRIAEKRRNGRDVN
jgi:hypothetical protein